MDFENGALQSHYSLLLDKLKTGDYFEYVATLSGFNNIDYQDEVFFVILKFFFLLWSFFKFYLTL